MDALEKGKHLARHAPRWVGQLARLGYAAIGTVYLLVAALAVMGILGWGGAFTGAEGAAQHVRSWPFSRILLGGIVIGLIVYVLWRGVQAVADVEERGRSWHGLARRAGLLLSGLSYAGLAAWAGYWFVTGQGALRDPKDDWTIQLMQHPAGRVAVAVLGAAVVAVALYQLYGAATAGFMRYLDTSGVGGGASSAMAVVGRIGLAGRAVVFLALGGYLVVAGWQQDPSEVMGIGGFFRMLNRQPYGHWYIGAVALGLGAFGLFMLLKAGFRYVLPRETDDVPYLEQDDAEDAQGSTQEPKPATA